MSIAQSAAQRARLAGARASLRTRGRIVKVVSDEEEDNEAEVTVLIEDAPMMPDMERPAQAMMPVYVTVASLAGAVENPRAVNLFSEGSKDYKVLEYIETAGDRILWKWKCEAQRDAF